MKKIKFAYPVDTQTECVSDKNGMPLSEFVQGCATKSIANRKLPVVYPEDFDGANISEKVSAMNDFVLNAGGGFEMYFGNTSTYLITKAIVIPSNTIVRIVDCTIQMANNTVDNMFRTANIVINPDDPYGFALNKRSIEACYNIGIIGEQSPTLLMVDSTNSYGERNWGWRAHTIEFVGVSNFEIAGFKTEKNIAWQIALTGCSYGSVHDIEFHSTRDNGDGIDVEFGSHDIEIYNISGDLSDDVIAVANSGPSRLEQRPTEWYKPTTPFDYDWRKFGDDTHDITVRNVHAKTAANVIDLICGDYGIYNVSISNISDSDGVHTGAANACVVVFAGQYDGGYHHGLIRNCSISDITANSCGRGAAIHLNGGIIVNGRINNVKLADDHDVMVNDSGIDPADYNFIITNTGTIN